MRADRLISILLLLQIHRQMTAHELARRLEVSERTIHRDMEALSAIGVPVVAERGVGGGWGLMDHYRTNLTGLNTVEIQTLFLDKPARLLEDLGLERASKAASIKLMAALPATARGIAEYARQRIHIDLSGWSASEERNDCLPQIQDAIWNQRKIRFKYDRGDCEGVERTADPLGLVAKGSAWYLMAIVDEDLRNYRVSRIRHVELLDEGSVRPENFDLASSFEASVKGFRERFPRYEVTFLVDQATLPRLKFTGRFATVEAVEGDSDDGRKRVRMRFQFDWEACEFAMGFGTLVEVVDPPELRTMILNKARNVVRFYLDNGQCLDS